MTIDDVRPAVGPELAPPDRPGRRWRVRSIDVACGLAGLGLGLVVAADGSVPWRAARLVLVAAVAAVIAGSSRWLPARRAAVGWVLLGAVAVPVGATIGYFWLTVAGPSVKGVGGLLAAVGGLVALVAGSAVLVRRARGWRRWLAVPIVLVLGYLVALPLGMAVYATNVPRPELRAATPADRGLRYQDASFRTADGVTLSAWYVPSTNRAAVVVLPGASSTRSDVLDQAVVLARHGYGVLLLDARGHGRSGGRAMDFGWYGEADAAAAVGYLAGRPDVDPQRIGALGESMGGEQAIGAMAADPRIAATVAEGATNRTFADRAWLPAEYGVRGRLQQAADWLTYSLADLLTAASPPIALRDAVRAAAPRPVLLIAAGGVPDEERADRYIQAAAPATVELWVVPGAGHIGGLHAQPAQWSRHVLAFLDRTLLGAA